jgi:hypothetical protein
MLIATTGDVQAKIEASLLKVLQEMGAEHLLKACTEKRQVRSSNLVE